MYEWQAYLMAEINTNARILLIVRVVEYNLVNNQIDELELDSDECEYEVKTITSAVKHYLRYVLIIRNSCGNQSISSDCHCKLLFWIFDIHITLQPSADQH